MRRNRCRHICDPAGSGHRPAVISGRNDGRRHIRFRRQLPQMLDAAHGKAVTMARKVQRRDGAPSELKQRSTRIAHSVGRRTPTEAGFHIGRQSPVRHVAVARSRRKRAIAQRNAAEREQVQFTIQNAKFTINRFSSRVRFHRCHSEEQSDEESVFVFFHDSRLSGLRAAPAPP